MLKLKRSTEQSDSRLTSEKQLPGAEITVENNTAIIRLKGDVDHHSLQTIRAEIDSVLETASPRITVLDFSDVPFCDSSAVGLILGRIRLCENFGGQVFVTGPNGYVRKILCLAGLESLIKN